MDRDDFIATPHENIVIDAGFSVGAAWPDCASADKWLSSNNPDAAIVDVEPQDKSCVKLVEKLSLREIPFLAISSLSADTQEIDPIFRSVPWLEKPVTSAGLQLALRSIL